MAVVPAANGGYAVHGLINQIAVAFLSIGAASISYRYVERPFLVKRRGAELRASYAAVI
jgi:peptidoglycan/LPS O-acetylase OafA/YrhL